MMGWYVVVRDLNGLRVYRTWRPWRAWANAEAARLRRIGMQPGTTTIMLYDVAVEKHSTWWDHVV